MYCTTIDENVIRKAAFERCRGADATTARTSTLSLPLRIEDVNDCAPVINGVALPNAHTLTALTGTGDMLSLESAAQRSELLVGFVEN